MIDRTSMRIREEIHEWIEWLANFGKSEGGGVTRLLYASAWQEAQHALKKKMHEKGLTPFFDDAGNLFGRLEGTERRDRVILAGSHIDTVIRGGKYDGAFGIIAAIIATEQLYARFGAPKQTIEVVSLCEEEGSRFHLSFWGSGTITGKYKLEDAETVEDSDGVTLADAMHKAGFGKGRYAVPYRDDIGCFLETHIEQGQTLEQAGHSWAPVTHIVGQRRYLIELSGESNHAGTTPMLLRKDALYAAAQMIAFVGNAAHAQKNGLVATVGKIQADPNVSNVIAGRCRFTVDVRHHEEETIESFCREMLAKFQQVAEKERVAVTINKWMDAAPVAMDQRLTQLNMDLAEEAGIACKEMVSGAGHDSQIFGTYCPTALMFVPSRQGISHSPKEFTALRDLEVGVQMLTNLLYRLAYGPDALH